MRGDVFLYDYGPPVGHEPAGRRRALVTSRDDLGISSICIALPTSGQAPPFQHRKQHVEIVDSNSWASVWQVGAIDPRKLGERVAATTSQELETVLETLVSRLTSNNRPGTIATRAGQQLVDRGTVWNVEFHNPSNRTYDTPMLVLDYNDGNKMAIAVRVTTGQQTESPIRVPAGINTPNGGQVPAAVLVHQVRPLDMSERSLERIGTIDVNALDQVKGNLLALLDPAQAQERDQRS